MANLSDDFPGAAPPGTATAASFDGSVVVGQINLSGSTKPFRWVSGVMEALEILSGATHGSAADVSPDGQAVVGKLWLPNSENEAFLWQAGQMTGLGDLPDGAFDSNANGVSEGGLTIAGTGTNPGGQQEAWIAYLGCAAAGDVNNDGHCDGADIAGFVRCLLTGLGCGCADFNGDQIVDSVDIGLFVDCLMT